MTYLRWLHKSWSFFWNFIGVLLATVVLCGVLAMGLVQLQPVQNYLGNSLINNFNRNYQGVLSIGDIDGIIPFRVDLNDVRLYADSSSTEPVLSAEKIESSLNLRTFVQDGFEVDGLKLTRPKVIIGGDSGMSLEKALQKKNPQEDSLISGSPVYFELLAPSVNVEEGFITVYKKDRKGLPDTITVRDIHLDMFLEFRNEQRFIDFDRLTFSSPELQIDNALVYGQVYNDEQFLEFNAFNATVGESGIRFGGEAEGVNLMAGKLAEQIRNSQLEVNVNELRLQPEYIRQYLPGFPLNSQPVYAQLQAEGSLDSLWFDELRISTGDSFIDSYGYLTHLNTSDRFGYGLNLDEFRMVRSDLESLDLNLSEAQLEVLAGSTVQGTVKGNLNELQAEVDISGSRGNLGVDGFIAFEANRGYELQLQADSLNLQGLAGSGFPETNLNLTGAVRSNHTDFRKGSGMLEINAASGMIAGREYESFRLTSDWENGVFNPEYTLLIDGAELSGTGRVNISTTPYAFRLNGSSDSLKINNLLQLEGLREALVDLEYEIKLNGSTPGELFGSVSLDIPRAYVAGDTLGRHQLYLDFNAPDSEVRSLRLSSTALDATLEGDYSPSELSELAVHWRDYFAGRIKDEILFSENIPAVQATLNLPDQTLNLNGQFKNPSLLKAYYPAFPTVETAAKINSTLEISPDRLLFNGSVSDKKFSYNETTIDSLTADIAGTFRYQYKLKEFSSLQIQAAAAHFERKMIEARGFRFGTELNRDSLTVTNSVDRLADRGFFTLQTTGSMRDTALVINIRDFDLGTADYAWQNQGTPRLVLSAQQSLKLDDFIFTSDEQYLQLEGTYSKATEDSVNYIVRGVELQRISDIINGRLSFGGEMNGVFTTRTLTTVPTISGDIDIERFNLDGNTVGDIELRSDYRQQLNRFDTRVRVQTDPEKYPQYFEGNDRQGQDLLIDGYIMAPENGRFADADSLYNFDIDLNNIDMWILPYIGPKVFSEASGRANGEGKLWGNLDTYDFRVDFDVGLTDAVYFQPQFLDTYYYAQGEITFTRENGLEFKDIFLIDPTGGDAVLSGNFDFNDFQPVSYFDIRLEMNEFQFLNSEFDPSLPFYGKAFGSSTVTITGSNINPVLSTATPVMISDFSRISIPLLEETDFEEDSKFIRFVNSFDLSDQENEEGEEEESRKNFAGVSEINPEDLTFAERFTLDLQFEAVNPMTVELIFDPVTGDVVTANGTGRIRIRLEDEEVSMYGRFDITDGRYQFVSGDIFTRRFEIEPGGSIVWEGNPADARLDLNAVYRARPDINTLTKSRADLDAENSQRVPVELVLNIGGTLSSIDNNFYFRLPNTFDTRQNTTLATQLNALNRNEDERLIQATSFLLMGDFIPVSSSGAAQTNSFSENLSGSAAVLNPLLSNQVISPLLSSQINSLLNSDLSSFDVDFNLNTYNEVDLGVALRLYNDKLILRREGQITGRQSNIGDLGATYRINQTFSVTAFHRQDLTFGTISSTDQSQQSQDINGVGVEAQFSFNRWHEFFNKIAAPFRKLFGSEKKNKEELTENTEGGKPSQDINE